MPPYKKLVIIVLAASSVSPALSAPTRECQKQSRGEVEERMNMVLLERLGTDFTLREVSAFPERSFGSSSKRATEAPESRAIVGFDRRYFMGLNGRPANILEGMVGVGGAALLGAGIYTGVKQHEKAKQQRDLS